MDQRSFRLLWMGQSLANIGDVFYIIGVIEWINSLTSSVLAMTLVPFILTAANFASGFFTPIFIDRILLKPLLLYSQMGKTGVLIILGAISLSTGSVVVIFTMVAIIGLLDGCANPVRNALVTYFVPANRLVKANSFLATMDQTIRLAGWPVGGLLLVAMGTASFLTLVMMLFAVSTVMMAGLSQVKRDFQDPPEGIWNSIKEGWLILWHHRVLRVLSTMDILETIASVVWIAAIMYVYVDEVLGVGKAWWGYINGAFFGGLMIGGLFVLKASRWIKHSPKTFIFMGLSGSAMVTFFFGLGTSAIMAIVLSVVMGILSQMKDITQQTIVQTNVGKDQLAKVYSAQGTLLSVVFGTASLVMGAFADIFGVRSIFYCAAGLLVAALIVAIYNREQFVIHAEE